MLLASQLTLIGCNFSWGTGKPNTDFRGSSQSLHANSLQFRHYCFQSHSFTCNIHSPSYQLTLNGYSSDVQNFKLPDFRLTTPQKENRKSNIFENLAECLVAEINAQRHASGGKNTVGRQHEWRDSHAVVCQFTLNWGFNLH